MEDCTNPIAEIIFPNSGSQWCTDSTYIIKINISSQWPNNVAADININIY